MIERGIVMQKKSDIDEMFEVMNWEELGNVQGGDSLFSKIKNFIVYELHLFDDNDKKD